MTAIQPLSAGALFKDCMQPFAPWDTTAPVAWSANTIRTVRVRAPRSGTLTSVVICVGVQSGNIEVGLADLGEQLAGSRSKIGSSGSIACPAAGPQIAWTANLPVVADRQYEFFLGADNATATFVRGTFGASGMYQLPAGIIDSPGGGLAKITSAIAAFPFGSSQLETSLGANSLAPWILGKIV